ncbi:uncharacterized protein BKA78DRAFT_172453 [Phyllosticta capitalensis]|uniref:uncharacterized protein n=1 Tax=Phyllosticta capitalensis TaxID=121624 RepID=UPI003130686E
MAPIVWGFLWYFSIPLHYLSSRHPIPRAAAASPDLAVDFPVVIFSELPQAIAVASFPSLSRAVQVPKRLDCLVS